MPTWNPTINPTDIVASICADCDVVDSLTTTAIRVILMNVMRRLRALDVMSIFVIVFTTHWMLSYVEVF